MVETRYITIGDHETTAAYIMVNGGTNSSGKMVGFRHEIGEDLYILVRRSEYWYD